jgi:hypothetical protein
VGARRRVALAAAVSAALLVPLALFGGSSFAKGFAAVAQYQYGGKTTLCHHTHSKKHPTVTITVANAAVKAHMRHHDTLGPCPSSSSTQESRGHKGKSADGQVTASAADGGHGDSGEHGNSGTHGNGHHG